MQIHILCVKNDKNDGDAKLLSNSWKLSTTAKLDQTSGNYSQKTDYLMCIILYLKVKQSWLTVTRALS